MRNNALDAAKLIACFFIVFVHVGNYPEIIAPWGETLRVMARWAVPFFFLASGYTLGNINANSLLKRVNKLVSILFYGSVIYIPIIYFQSGENIFKTLNKILSADTLHYGLYGHLWFVGSLITGLVLFGYARANLTHKQSILLSCIIIIMCWFGDFIKSFGVELWFFYTFRYLIGFALVYIGWAIGIKRLRLNVSAGVVFIFFLLFLNIMGAEYYVSYVYFDGTHGERQFPLACIPAAMAVIYMCENIIISQNVISQFGVNYSLGIYITHPLVIYVLGKLFGTYRIQVTSSVMLLCAFSSSFILLFVLNKLTPFIYKKLNGVGVT